MVPGGGHGNGGGRGGGRREPPGWSPENQNNYPYHVWVKDLMTWSLIVGDMEMSQQAAMVIMNLSGAAREIARQMTFEEITGGGMITDEQGVQAQADPLSYLLWHLAHRFAPLGEESRLQAMGELYNFSKKPNETIDSLITRFESVRHRARTLDGGITMNWEGTAWLIIKAVGCSHQQLLTLLQPFNNTMPRTEQEYAQLCTSLRRMGHVLERSPYNIASSLGHQAGRGPFSRQFYVHDEPETSDHGDRGWSQYDAASADYEHEPSPSYPVYEEEEYSGTDTDTASSAGEELYLADDPELCDMTEAQAGEHLFWAYQQAKSRWRRFTGKPTRNVRRFVRRRKGKGKGQERLRQIVQPIPCGDVRHRS